MQPEISLKSRRPLVSGAYRHVYQHPADDGLLIKVIKPPVVKEHARRYGWLGLDWRGGHYRGLLREVKHYLSLRKRGQHTLPFIQHFVGIVETDRGLGMVVRKVRGRDGKLAPTVSALVRKHGLSEELRSRLNELCDEVVRHHVVFGDITGNNIVAADDEEHGNRLVIVDGLSDDLWLPISSLSRAVNSLYCRRRFARALRELDALRGSRPRPRPARRRTAAPPA